MFRYFRCILWSLIIILFTCLWGIYLFLFCPWAKSMQVIVSSGTFFPHLMTEANFLGQNFRSMLFSVAWMKHFNPSIVENLLKSIFQLSSLRIVNWVTVPPVIINFLSSFYCGVTCCMFAMKDKSLREIVLKAMGQAISKSVAIAEIIKVGADPHFHNCVLRVFWVAVAHPLTIITFPFWAEEFSSIASGYSHQFGQRNWCVGTYRRGTCTVSHCLTFSNLSIFLLPHCMG